MITKVTDLTEPLLETLPHLEIEKRKYLPASHQVRLHTGGERREERGERGSNQNKKMSGAVTVLAWCEGDHL